MSGDPHKTFYLETFGCPMNVHDSEKVIGTLVHEGYQQVETVEQADLILYNTCSIRDKAEQKVFHRLADYKKLLKQGKKFGVLGCVAQQEGEKIFERAPHVSLVCGSASLPQPAGRCCRNSKARKPRKPEAAFQMPGPRSPRSDVQGLVRITGLDDRETDECFETEFTAHTTRIAATSPSSKAATNSAPTALSLSRAAKNAAAPPTRCSPKPARWPIAAIRKSSCLART